MNFHDESSAHKYYKGEVSLHCGFLSALSKLFWRRKIELLEKAYYLILSLWLNSSSKNNKF